jgi:Na+/H+-dicarboxylate symporter
MIAPFCFIPFGLGIAEMGNRNRVGAILLTLGVSKRFVLQQCDVQ